jgi:hypothetical protein
MADDREIDPDEIEAAAEICPLCGGLIMVLWAKEGGVISHPAYVLVADWIIHGTCWDALVERLPPVSPEVERQDWSGDFESWGDDR